MKRREGHGPERVIGPTQNEKNNGHLDQLPRDAAQTLRDDLRAMFGACLSPQYHTS